MLHYDTPTIYATRAFMITPASCLLAVLWAIDHRNNCLWFVSYRRRILCPVNVKTVAENLSKPVGVAWNRGKTHDILDHLY